MAQTSRSLHYIGSQLLDETAPMAGKSCHSDIIYAVETREGGGGGGRNNPKTMLKGRMGLQRMQEIHVHVDNRRPLTSQAYQYQLKACTGAGAQTNTAKCKGMQTPARCTGTSASQNIAGARRNVDIGECTGACA